MFFSKSCLPTSGLNWSSPISTSAGKPPSLPPFILTASMKASLISMPRLAEGPDKVLMKPTLTASAAAAGLIAPTAPARTAVVATAAEASLPDPNRLNISVLL
jgi:hypothetical protein